MFSLFKTKPVAEKLQKKYELLMQEWHSLLNVNRKKSDQKFAEAQDILNKIDREKWENSHLSDSVFPIFLEE